VAGAQFRLKAPWQLFCDVVRLRVNIRQNRDDPKFLDFQALHNFIRYYPETGPLRIPKPSEDDYPTDGHYNAALADYALREHMWELLSSMVIVPPAGDYANDGDYLNAQIDVALYDIMIEHNNNTSMLCALTHDQLEMIYVRMDAFRHGDTAAISSRVHVVGGDSPHHPRHKARDPTVAAPAIPQLGWPDVIVNLLVGRAATAAQYWLMRHIWGNPRSGMCRTTPWDYNLHVGQWVQFMMNVNKWRGAVNGATARVISFIRPNFDSEEARDPKFWGGRVLLRFLPSFWRLTETGFIDRSSSLLGH
jgi:hypothetical protein